MLDEGEKGGRVLSRMVLEGNVVGLPDDSRDQGMGLGITAKSNKELPLLLALSSPLSMVSTIGPDYNPVRGKWGTESSNSCPPLHNWK